MTCPNSDWDLLRNAVRQPIAALTAVEVDTVAHAHDIMQRLRTALGDRPYGLLPLNAQRQYAVILLDAARDICKKWEDEQGVLFIIDQDENDDTTPDFWRTMNMYREHWGAMSCHVVFMLLPANYRFLMQIADHLADWIPLKLHILGGDGPVRRQDINANIPSVFASSDLSPRAARQLLTALEAELGEALLHDRLDHKTLVRRYYLPMLDAAYAIRDLNRDRSLREKIDERNVPKADIAKWLLLNGLLDFELHELSSAETALMRLLTIAQERKDETLLATACHNLGMIAQQRRDFSAAEAWYSKALEIVERLRIEYAKALIYHQLGMTAQDQHNLDTAEAWYRKSLEIVERQDDEYAAAQTYHQLGMIARERRDFDTADAWYRQSLEIKERLGNEHGAAITYQQLGMIAQERRDFDAAESWYHQSLEITKRQGDDQTSAMTYHQLGMIAQERRDFDTADKLYRQSLEITKRHRNYFEAAVSYSALGYLYYRQKQFIRAGEFYLKAILAYNRSNAPEKSQQLTEVYSHLMDEAGEKDRPTLLEMWKNADLGELP